MRPSDEQSLALECLRIARGDIDWAGKMLDFLTGGTSGSSESHERPLSVDTLVNQERSEFASSAGVAGGAGFDVDPEARMREIAREIARCEIDADAVWQSRPGFKENPTVLLLQRQLDREDAILAGERLRLPNPIGRQAG